MESKPIGSIWTDEQWLAIVKEGTNILVSAGAGSGKTAVLTERILRKLKASVDIDELVVLTFTNAAAAQMKEKVREKLIKEIKESNDVHLQTQLEKLDESLITTFDSFCMSIVKENYYKLGIKKNVQIVDRLYIEQKKDEIITLILENKFMQKDEEFLKLIDKYTIDNYNDLKKELLKLYDKYKQTINPMQIDHFYTNKYIDSKAMEFIKLLLSDVNKMKDTINELSKYNDEGVIDGYLEKINEKYLLFFDATTYNEVIRAVNHSKEYKNPRRSIKVDNEGYTLANEQLKKLLIKIEKMCVYESYEEMIEGYKSTYNFSKQILLIIDEFDKELENYKNENAIYEFLDINLLALKLLKDEEIQTKYKNQISEILIDEYQDTNDIQEECIKQISDNNVYMVGDIKQAIYGFRNANPDIFKEKYEAYEKNNGGFLIDLNKNFRSRQEVLENINVIFERNMDEKLGAVKYTDKQRLVFGNETYSTHNPLHDNNMDIYTYSRKEVNKDIEESKYFEIHLVAQDIIDKIENKYQVLDNGKLRDCRLGDFTILTEKRSRHAMILKIFQAYNINVQIKDLNDSYSVAKEVIIIKNLLGIIYSLNDEEYFKKNFKFCALAYLRSYLFAFDDNKIHDFIMDISKLTKSDKFSLEVVKYVITQSEFSSEFESIINIANEAKMLSIYEILSKAISEVNVYENIINLVSPIDSEKRIYKLLEVADFFDASRLTLSDFVEYLMSVKFEQKDKSIEAKLDIEFKSLDVESENAVNVMSIHKSKGLEFPICYFIEFSSNFNTDDLKQNIVFDKDFGLIIQSVNGKNQFKDVFVKSVYKEKCNEDIIGEKIRLLYVALTRAKEKMILFVDAEKNKELMHDVVPLFKRKEYRNFENMLSNIANHLDEFMKPVDINEFERKMKKQLLMQHQKQESEEKTKVQFKKLEKQNFEIAKERASMNLKAVTDKLTKKNIEYGNKLHEKLEFIDFNNIDFEITNQSKQVAQALQKIKDIVGSDDNINYYTEYQFQYEKDTKQITGIIDLLVITDQKVYIIDYKLSDIHKAEYEKQLKTYYEYISLKVKNKEIKAILLSILTLETKEVLC